MKEKDVKKLWGRAANRCAFPECRTDLTADGDLDTIGEMAHIIAKKPDGPRGRKTYNGDDIDGYENRILLCPNHHSIIDNNPKEWSVDKLKTIKNEH